MGVKSLGLFFFFLISFSQGTNLPGDGDSDNTLNIGLLLPYSGWPVGQKIGAAILVGKQKVNDEQILPDFSIDYLWIDTQCSAYHGLTGAMDIWSNLTDLDVFIGGGCSEVCEPVALVSAVWNTPHISWGCNSADLSDKHKYPTFSRTVGPWVSLAPMIADLLTTFGWTRAGIVATTENVMQLTANAFRDEILRRGYEVYRHDEKTVAVESADRLRILKENVRVIKSEARIIILIMGQKDINQFLIAAREEQMTNGEYVFISIDANPDHTVEGSSNEAALTEGYQGFISCNVRKPSGSEWDTFAADVVDKFSTFDSSAPALTADEVDVHAGMLHDAVLLWAYGVNKTISSHGVNKLDDGIALTANVANFTFEGITGTVIIDENGDRKPDYSIQIVQNGTYVTLLDYISIHNSLIKIHKADKPNDWSGILWAGHSSSIPKGEPNCGWDNEHCSKTTLYIVIGMVCSVIFVVAVVAAVYAERKVSYEREVYNEDLWKISWNDVHQNQIVSQIASQRAALHAKKTLKSLGKGRDTLSRTIIGRYKGANVAIKQLNRSSVDVRSIGRKLLVEIKQIRDLKHENINPFVAACTEAPHVCLLMGYCSKGSLQEVLHNDAFNLTDEFRISIASDIAKGMHYLHKSPIKSHGSLTSNNIVIDSRWVAKVTDYGFSAFKEGIGKKIESQLWTAPELLRNRSEPLVYGTQPGDVYSYGIILSEIVTRALPFAKNDIHHNVSDILDRVKNASWPNCRPFIPPETCSHYWSRLMSSCWREVASERLSFKTIKFKIKEINGGREINALDNMLNMLEQHSEQLEEVIEEKSLELEYKRQQCKALLLSRVPRDVMEELEEDIVKPGGSESITILNTGLHGFHHMVTKYSPHEITGFLTDIWWKMDHLCELYDVFKTDGISSDGQIVISRQDDQITNAEAVCSIALKMLCEVQTIHTPILEGKLLPWKAAIHSDKCVTVILGEKCPRYAVFGNAIDITNKLLEIGTGLNVLVSSNTQKLLHQNQLYQFEENKHHQRELSGIEKSFWLQQKIGDEEQLPDSSTCVNF